MSDQEQEGEGEITEAIKDTIRKVAGNTSMFEKWRSNGELDLQVMEAME